MYDFRVRHIAIEVVLQYCKACVQCQVFVLEMLQPGRLGLDEFGEHLSRVTTDIRVLDGFSVEYGVDGHHVKVHGR